ncbi:MAG: PAS domain-containing protein [Burkholderiaceae bacterium]
MKDKSSVESRLHELLECSEDGLILLDLADEVGASALNARVAYVNPAACALLGLESDCNQDDILAKLERNVRFMGSGGSIRDLLRSEVPWCADVSLPHGADGRQAYRLRASPVFNGLAIMLDRPWFSGAVPGQAADPDAPMDTLIHYLAHELRTPLAGISNAQFILGSLAADAPRAEQARAIGERQKPASGAGAGQSSGCTLGADVSGFWPEAHRVGALIDASLTGASHELDHRQIRVSLSQLNRRAYAAETRCAWRVCSA